MDAVFVRGKYFSTSNIDTNRILFIYPEIYLLQDPFKENHFKTNGIILRFEFDDTSEQSNRYSLYGDKLTVKSTNNSIVNNANEIPSVGEYDDYHYLSEFSHTLKKNDIEQISSMISENSITLEIQTINHKFDFETIKFVDSPILLNYIIQGEDIQNLKNTISLYKHLLKILGEYGIHE